MAKSLVPKKPTKTNDNLPAVSQSWMERLAADATKATALGGGGISTISTKGGKLTFNGAVLTQPVPLVILDQVRENAYYEGEFDPDETKPPVCFAIKRIDKLEDEEEMAPPADLPTKQSDRCSTCWANGWGTAERGKGKACKNRLRLGVIYAKDTQPGALKKQDAALIRVPPTSIKFFKKYVMMLAGGMRRPPYAVGTNLELIDDDQAMFKFEFEMFEAFNEAQLEVIDAKRAAIADDMTRTFAVAEVTERPKGKPGKPKPRARAKYDVAAPARKGKTPQRD